MVNRRGPRYVAFCSFPSPYLMAFPQYLQDLLPVRTLLLRSVPRGSQPSLQAHDGPPNDRVPPDLPPEILELHHSFPFGSREIRHRSSHMFLPYVPDRDRALHLSHLYFANIGWM
jgi:hypothetical protein